MTTQPEALRLADALDYGIYDAQMARVMDKAAAELRRLHAENEAFGIHLSERMKDLAEVEAQRDALVEALERIAQLSMSQFHIPYDMAAEACNIARAVIKAVEEN